jgi:hypothetical protein
MQGGVSYCKQQLIVSTSSIYVLISSSSKHFPSFREFQKIVKPTNLRLTFFSKDGIFFYEHLDVPSIR